MLLFKLSRSKAFIKSYILLLIFLIAVSGFIKLAYSATPDIISSNPLSGETLSSKKFNLTIETDINSTCRFDYSDKEYDLMSFAFFGEEKIHSFSVNESSDGEHIYYIRCRQNSNSSNATNSSDTMLESYEIKISIDSTPPEIISYSPNKTDIYKSDIILSVKLNEDGKCRISLNNVSYYTMTDDMIKADNVFTKSIEYYFDGEKSYYVDCIDDAGNTLKNRFKFHFNFHIPPSAKIIFDKNPPLTEGTYKITLITSEEVIQTPSLKYTFDGNKYFYVPLTGSKTKWTGYMVINNVGSSNALVGSFSFSGEDLQGNTGTLITSNKIFLVDTKTPKKITTIKAASKENGHIKLIWNYNDPAEDIKYYKIYRSSTKPINALDFYDDSYTEYFLDDVVIPGTVYYYAVSAVDEAGNEGPLSNPIEVLSELNIKKNKTIKKSKLDPETEKFYQNSINEVKSILQNVSSIQDNKYLSALGFKSKLASAENTLNGILKEMKSLNTTDSAKFKLDLNKLLLRARKQKSNIPYKISEENLTKLPNIVTNEDYQTAVFENINSLRLGDVSEKLKDKYLKKSNNLVSEFNISTEVKTLKIQFLDQKERIYTLFKKTAVSESENSESISLVEIIPKELASSSSEVIFLNSKNVEVIKKDPIFRLNLDGKTEKFEYSYLIGKDLGSELEQTQPTSVALYDALNFFFGDKKKSITGNLIKPISSSSNFLYFIIGVIAIAGLLVYYFSLDGTIDLEAVGNFAAKTFSNILPMQKSKKERNDKNTENSVIENSISENSEILEKLEPNKQTGISENKVSFKNADKTEYKNSDKLFERVIDLCEMIVRENYNLIKSTSYVNQTLFSAPENEAFILKDKRISNLLELAKELENISEEEFNYYVNDEKNDFANWIQYSLKLPALAEKIKKLKSKNEIRTKILEFLTSAKMPLQ